MKEALITVLLLIIATAAQGLYPQALTIQGVKPDLILVVLIWWALRTDSLSGALMGFAAGLLHGAAVGMRLGTFIATRTIGGFLAGSVSSGLFGQNPLVPVAATLAITVVVQTMFLLLSPVTGLAAAFAGILIEAVYNGVLVLIFSFVAAQFQLHKRIRLAQDRFRA